MAGAAGGGAGAAGAGGADTGAGRGGAAVGVGVGAGIGLGVGLGPCLFPRLANSTNISYPPIDKVLEAEFSLIVIPVKEL